MAEHDAHHRGSRREDYGGSSPTDAVSRGGYQRPGEEGRRRFDPGSRPRAGQTGRRGMPDGAAEEATVQFDEDRIIERVDQDHRGRGPKGWRRTDARLAEEVNDRLLDAPDVDATDIEVAVREAEAVLTGTVATRAERRRAEEIAEDVRGILFVDNRLRVAPAAGPSTGRGGELILPTGAGSEASATSASGVTGMAAGTGAAAGGDPLLGAEETQGRRYAQAPVDGSG